MQNYERRPTHAQHAHWLSLNFRSIHLSRVVFFAVLFLAFCSFSEKHLWCWDWHNGFHAWYNCHPVTDAYHHHVDAWRWVEGREIRLYAPQTMDSLRATRIAEGIRGLIRDLHLNITVRVVPTDARIERAIALSSTGSGPSRTINFNTLCQELLATRDGRYAEVVIAPGMIDGASDTAGMSYFNYGVILLDDQCASGFLARHETGHLLGYHLHDNWPIAVLGYSNPSEGTNDHVSNLMMPVPEGGRLSPRAHDALISFWQGLEQRTGQHYFIR